MYKNRGKYRFYLEEETGGEAGGTGGGLDLSAAQEQLSADLFGTSSSEGTVEGGAADTAPVTTQVTEPAPAAEATAPATTTDPAPKTWRPEAAAKWATLPDDVRAEIAKREADMFRGLEGYKAEAGVGKQFKEAVAPFLEQITAEGEHPIALAASLMKAHTILRNGAPEQKVAIFQKLAEAYGVNLTGEQPYIDPAVQGLQKTVSELNSKLTARERQEAEATRSKLQAELETFASDPAHPYFDEVATDIAAFLKSGAAKDLKEAYEKAVWANPVTRAKEQARATADAEAKVKADATAHAAKAKKAAGANVTTKSKPASGTAPLGSIDDTLSAALADIKARG